MVQHEIIRSLTGESNQFNLTRDERARAQCCSFTQIAAVRPLILGLVH